MTNLITISIPNDDTVAAHHFGEALIRLAAAREGRPYPVVGEEETRPMLDEHELMRYMMAQSRKAAGDTRYQTTVTNFNTSEDDVARLRAERLTVLNEEVEQKLAEADPALVLYAAKDYIFMMSADNEECQLAKSDAERDELIAKGYRAVTDKDVTEWEGSTPSSTEIPDVDTAGVKWDERIHSSSKNQVANGTWRLRRKPAELTDEQWTQLQQDVKASQQMPETVSAEDVFHTDTGEVTETEIAAIPPVAPPVLPPVAPPLPPVSVAPPVAPPAPAQDEEVKTFPELMAFVTDNFDKLSGDKIQLLCQRAKIDTIRDLNAKPELIPAFLADIKQNFL